MNDGFSMDQHKLISEEMRAVYRKLKLLEMSIDKYYSPGSSPGKQIYKAGEAVKFAGRELDVLMRSEHTIAGSIGIYGD